MFLCNAENDIRIEFEITEVEYDRAEGAQLSFILKHPHLNGSFHGFWWSRSQVLGFIEQLEKTSTIAQIQDDEYCLSISTSEYSSLKAAGIRINRSFGKKLKDFPLSASFSFEISETCLTDFMEGLKKLERACRP